jgi:hypothetical protein
MNVNLKLGVIDSGVRDTPAGVSVFTKRFDPDSVQAPVPDRGHTHQEASSDQMEHGSAIAKIILEKVPFADLFMAQVFQQKLVTTPNQVAAAINWLVGEGVQLINMSFGLTNDRDVLRNACHHALDHGVILVAAASARGDPVYPANYPGVIRATGDARCSPNEISCLNTDQADFGGHVISTNGIIKGASVGCAYIAAFIASYLFDHRNKSPEEIIKWLTDQAKYQGPESKGTMPGMSPKTSRT